MDVCALVPDADAAAANSALSAQGFGPGNFQSSIGPSGWHGLHAWGNDAFLKALESIDGVVFSDPFGSPADRVSNASAQAQAGSSLLLWNAQTAIPPIYLKTGAGPATVEAADFLADRLAESSGKTAPTVSYSETPEIVGRAILIGFVPDRLTNDREAYFVHATHEKLYLFGVDEFDPDNPNLYGGSYNAVTDSFKFVETNYMTKTGSADAVMYFLMKHVGVVWALPGPFGRVTPSHASLSVPLGRERKRHHCVYRNCLRYSRPGVGAIWPHASNASGYGREVLKFNRCFHTPEGDVTHAFGAYFNKYHVSGDPGDPSGANMDLFALQPDGTRGFPVGGNIKMEVGEPRLLNVWVVDNGQFVIDKNPLSKTVGCGFQDGHSQGQSVDPRAQAWDYTGPDAELVPLVWRDSGGQYPALTDREVEFANRCAAKFAQTYPERDDWLIGMQAYGPTRPAPKVRQMRDNVYCINVANCMNTRYGEGAWQFANMSDWCQGTHKNLWRPNVGRGHGHQGGLWMTQVHEVGAMLRTWGENCIGVVPDYWWENWSTQWPLYYSVMRWQVDPETPVDTVMNDAYQKLFGTASAHIKAYYEATEAVIDAYQVHNASFPQLEAMWNDTKLAEFQAHIDAAKAAVADPSIELDRIEWVEDGLQWGKDYMQCIKWSNIYAWAWEFVDGTELATASNAAEDDTDNNGGWSYRYGSAVSQSEVTNGSSFALELSSVNGDTHREADRVMPGTAGEKLQVELDIKHIEGNDVLAISQRLPTDAPSDHGDGGMPFAAVSSFENGFARYKMILDAGNTLRLRTRVSGQDGKFVIDNLSIKRVTALDTTQIITDWELLADQMVARQESWANDTTRPRPIGNASARGDRIPRYNTGPPAPDDPNLV